MLDSFKSVIASTIHHSKPTFFCHPSLSEEEMGSGCRLGLYSWAGTSCSGKHAYVDEFVEGESVNVASDKEDGTVVLLEHNTTIYMGD